MRGYNATIFAYGHTGAGKTYTMQGTPTDPGLMQRTLSHLLHCLQEKQSKFQSRWTLNMSYLEIYREKVYDLLCETPGTTDLPLREDVKRNIVIPGLSEVPIKSVDDFEVAFEMGQRNRSMAATKLNSQSSRSHACLTFILEQRPPIGLALKSKLHLIDLAGSEDNRRTANTGTRLAESGSINSSLFVLGQVVDALNKAAPRIPYRDSKLTRMLQDSLGGKAYSLIITNAAPTSSWLVETCASLNFASKSRAIQNRVVLNTVEEEPTVKPVVKAKKAVPRKRRDDSDVSSEEEDSVYEMSEPPSSVQRPTQSGLPTPPETHGKAGRKRHLDEENPFIDRANPLEDALEKQIEAKVAAKLREISKGTILR